MEAAKFEHSIEVLTADIDPLQHINNVAFLRYVQDAAVAHWRSVAPADISASVTWVVRKHEIEYFRPGLPDDQLFALTWVGEPTGASWPRLTEIRRRSDGDTLVKAQTIWVQLDAVTHRPKRIDRRLVDALLNSKR